MTQKRYARQISLPEIGEAGQERLLAARIDHVLSPTTRDYLVRAGVTVERAPSSEAPPSATTEWEEVHAAFTAVEEMKRILGVGTPGRLEGFE